MVSRVGIAVAVAALVAGAYTTGHAQSKPPQSSTAKGATEDHSGHATAKKVFFVEPKNGATVKQDLHVVFGSEQVTISPVPAGDVKDARPGMVHYHLAVDADCLKAGQVIPKADPWVHFGKGQDNADLQLKPGKHKLTVQAGDDLHKTVAGLCQTITVTAK
jgi:hypothetical protein